MNSRLAKIAIEMQLEDKKEKKCDYFSFNKKCENKIFGLFKSAFVTIPVDKD